MSVAVGKWCDVLGGVLDLLYPRSCAVCDAPVTAGCQHLCWECRTSLEWVTEPFCEWCGDPIDGQADGSFTCWWCRRYEPKFDRARSAARFRGALREALHGFKYLNATALRGDLVAMLRATVETHYSDCLIDAVVPVPLFPRRERERSYNQSQLLASGLGASLGLHTAPRCLARIRDTQTQTNLKSRQRRHNVRGAFAATDPEWIQGRRLLLVDDVMTTGATVAECSRVLKHAGAAAVYVVTVARG